MTYEDLQNIFKVEYLTPWEHDYYWAFFPEPADRETITARAFEIIPEITRFYCVTRGNHAYIIVPKGTVIPEEFLENIEAITDVPEEPAPEEGE